MVVTFSQGGCDGRSHLLGMLTLSATELVEQGDASQDLNSSQLQRFFYALQVASPPLPPLLLANFLTPCNPQGLSQPGLLIPGSHSRPARVTQGPGGLFKQECLSRKIKQTGPLWGCLPDHPQGTEPDKARSIFTQLDSCQ